MLPSREQAIELLKQNGCQQNVINHCLAVTEFALKLAHKLHDRGLKLDLQLVEAGAILHDLGRSKTHEVQHSLVGAQMAQELGLPQSIVNIIKRHVGAGITDEEAELLGWPKDTYMPQTLEEKVVCYADKRIDHDRVASIEEEIKKLQKHGFAAGAERVRNLHDEITKLLGETP
ncbi:MAG: HDIG domain-containing metalloprotein [Candidatus Bathyarchaeia archaeon]